MDRTADARFSMGQVSVTPGIIQAVRELRSARNGVAIVEELLLRHQQGDWGYLDEEDRAVNEEALHDGSRIVSSYFLPDETTVLVITDGAEEDDVLRRPRTTLLLLEEY